MVWSLIWLNKSIATINVMFQLIYIYIWEMLTSALRALIKNLVKKKKNYGKKKIKVLRAFFISHKSDVKTFLK